MVMMNDGFVHVGKVHQIHVTPTVELAADNMTETDPNPKNSIKHFDNTSFAATILWLYPASSIATYYYITIITLIMVIS